MQVEVKAVWLGNKGSGVTSSSRVKAVDSVMGVRKPTFKRSYNPTRLNSNYLFHSVSMMMVSASVIRSKHHSALCRLHSCNVI